MGAFVVESMDDAMEAKLLFRKLNNNYGKKELYMSMFDLLGDNKKEQKKLPFFH